MIRIEHISFEFTAPDEGFAQGLYADWDGFCRRCFERVAEECLAPYGDDRALHELERLDLDLGNIPEDNFYDEFPRRLREELLKALPPLYGPQAQAGSSKTAASRSRNLLYYLEHGHPLPEWADAGFRLQEELERLDGSSSASYGAFIREAALLCLRREHALRRLAGQTEQEKPLLDLYAAALAEPSAGQAEKRRLLALLLETKPGIPVRFVHETPDDARLRDMSALLDTLSVRQLIRTETKEHAEVDLPPYWHYLYEWLIKYYPYNGIAMFGGKAEFTRHLHHQLLTFICKRNGAPYLSKAELTVSFLLEVFGPAYYKDVLNAIYLLQPHNPDGSPVYDHYFNRELYRMFLRLSLLRLPEAAHEGAATNESQEKTKEIQGLIEPGTVTSLLTDTHTDDKGKRTLLSSFAQSHPETLIQWLQSEGVKSPELLSALARLTDKAVLDRLLASLSFTVWEQVTKAESHLRTYKPEIPWLKAVPEAAWLSAWRKSVFVWIGSKHYSLPEEESVRRLLFAFRNELGGTTNGETDSGHEKVMEKLSADIRSESRQPSHIPIDTEELARILKDPSRNDAYKRMLWTMLVREQPEAAIRWLQSVYAKDNTLLPLLAELAEDATVSRLLGAYSLAVFEAWGNIRNYLETHRDSISWLKGIPELQRASTFRLSALHLMASGIPGQADDVKNILRLIYREVTGGDKNEDAAVDTLARELEEAGSQTAIHEGGTSTDKHSITLQDLSRIMHNPDLSETAKRRAVASYWDYHREHTIEAVRLLQEQGMLDEVLERTGHYAWEILLYRTLRQAVGMGKASALMPLFQWLAGHETALSSYRADNGHSLPAGLLLGIARWEQDGQDTLLQNAVHSLLVSLFREDSLPIIWKQLSQDTATGTAGASDAEQAFMLLDAALDGESHDFPSFYQEWLHGHEDALNTLQILFEQRWNTAESFATWLEDTSVPIAAKREQLRKAAQEKPQAWLQLLRALPQESRASASLENLMSVQDLLQAP